MAKYIKLYEGNQVIGLIKFINNLTLEDVPDYVNENGLLGICRVTMGRLDNEIVLMTYDCKKPSASYAEVIDKKLAYDWCMHRNKPELVEELELEYVEEREVL